MLLEILTLVPRLRLRRATAIKIRALESTLETIRTERTRSIQNGSTTLRELHEASLYLLLLSLDHTVLLHDLALERNKLRRTVYSKHLILLFSEFFDDFPMVLGSRVKSVIEKLPQSSTHVASLDEICKGLRSYRKKHEKDFYKIRNIVAAHRDLNSELQLTTLKSIDHSVIQDLASDFDMWLNQVWIFLATAVNDYSNSKQMLLDICRHLNANTDSK